MYMNLTWKSTLLLDYCCWKQSSHHGRVYGYETRVPIYTNMVWYNNINSVHLYDVQEKKFRCSWIQQRVEVHLHIGRYKFVLELLPKLCPHCRGHWTIHLMADLRSYRINWETGKKKSSTVAMARSLVERKKEYRENWRIVISSCAVWYLCEVGGSVV